MDLRVFTVGFVLIILFSSCRMDTQFVTEHISHSGVRRLVIQADSFQVSLSGTAADAQSPGVLSGDMRIPSIAAERYYRVDSGQNEDTFTIRVRPTLNFRLFYQDQTGGPKIELLVPPGLDVLIETTSGVVSLTDLNCASLEVRTVSSPIRLMGCQGAKRLRSNIGDIVVDSSAGSIDASTITGGITVTNLAGRLSAVSTAGSIRTSGGHGTVDLSNAVGTIDSQNLNVEGNCRFQTTTGSNNVRLAADLSHFRFDLQSTTGSLRVGTQEAAREFTRQEGEFGILGRSTTGAQNYQ